MVRGGRRRIRRAAGGAPSLDDWNGAPHRTRMRVRDAYGRATGERERIRRREKA